MMTVFWTHGMTQLMDLILKNFSLTPLPKIRTNDFDLIVLVGLKTPGLFLNSPPTAVQFQLRLRDLALRG
jgi:hypothetical protein